MTQITAPTCAYSPSVPVSELSSYRIRQANKTMPNQALPPSLQYIADQLHQTGPRTPGQMRTLVLEAKVQPADLMPWARFNHPPEDSYGRTMAYKGPNFEIMVMSWLPGDFSGLHDHGYTQWGAVQVFGNAEHATFRLEDSRISTLARWQMKPYEVIGVHHDLIHQMGNPADGDPFLSLHVYGEPIEMESITGDARVFELYKGQIQRVDGGVFFGLPPELVKSSQPGPQPDFPTRIRFLIELLRRLKSFPPEKIRHAGYEPAKIWETLLSDQQHPLLLEALQSCTTETGHIAHSASWKILNRELRELALFQAEHQPTRSASDQFHRYARRYDALIGQPALDQFVKAYLQFATNTYHIRWQESRLLSFGCGTGLTEAYIADHFGIPKSQIMGLDISPAMVQEAASRIPVEQMDILLLDQPFQGKTWDIVYSGLNVFHYVPHSDFPKAIAHAAAQLRPGGYFIGDFITPDHIRWYPNVMYSEDKNTLSLRTPCLIEEAGASFQQSEILNIHFEDQQMEVSYAGKHHRFLPPVHRVRAYFNQFFGGGVALYDAVTREPIPESADSCTSTRYLVVAVK